MTQSSLSTIYSTNAYVAVCTSFNVLIIMSYFPAVAKAAPLVGLIVGCGMIYLCTKGYR
jgi:hypothetical protein